MRLPRVALAVAALVAVAGCGPTAPTQTVVPTTLGPTLGPTDGSTASDPPAEGVYAAIRRDVAGIRALEPTADVAPVTIDEATLRRNLEAEFDAEWTPKELAVAEDMLIGLGLLPPGSSLRQLTLDLQAGQVAGYYSPDKNQLFVVSRSGRLGATERVTYAHEFTHQLQDQHVDLNKLGLDAPDQSDRALAVLSLIEGDATHVQTVWTQEHLTPEELGELLAAALDPEAIEALRRAPRYLRETTLFTYEAGLAFVDQVMTAGGGTAAVDAAFRDPPVSTEQVIHPDRYLDRDAPTVVSIPAGLAEGLGAGWSEAGRDTLGELLLRIWLQDGGLPRAQAFAAAEGWDGDRLAIFRGPSGAVGIGLVTTWDSAADAEEFRAAAALAADALELDVVVNLAPGGRDVMVAVGDRASEIAAALGG
jgi:hypothetical protein